MLLAAHSMGSVIAYDALWEMSRDARDELRVDLLLTMGSPLGQSYLRRHILGHGETGPVRYPDNIRRWVNLSAVGDMTAVNPYLAKDFGEMARRRTQRARRVRLPGQQGYRGSRRRLVATTAAA